IVRLRVVILRSLCAPVPATFSSLTGLSPALRSLFFSPCSLRLRGGSAFIVLIFLKASFFVWTFSLFSNKTIPKKSSKAAAVPSHHHATGLRRRFSGN